MYALHLIKRDMVKFIYSKVCQFCYGVNKIIYCFIIPCLILAKIYSQAHIFFLWPWKDWCNMVICIFNISVRDVYLIRIYELWNIKYHFVKFYWTERLKCNYFFYWYLGDDMYLMQVFSPEYRPWKFWQTPEQKGVPAVKPCRKDDLKMLTEN